MNNTTAFLETNRHIQFLSNWSCLISWPMNIGIPYARNHSHWPCCYQIKTLSTHKAIHSAAVFSTHGHPHSSCTGWVFITYVPVRINEFMGMRARYRKRTGPDSKVHGANMGPIWGWQDPGGPHVGPMNFAIWGWKPSGRDAYFISQQQLWHSFLYLSLWHHNEATTATTCCNHSDHFIKIGYNSNRLFHQVSSIHLIKTKTYKFHHMNICIYIYILCAFWISMCDDKSRNTCLCCVHWQWNAHKWCQLNALQALPVMHLVTSLSFFPAIVCEWRNFLGVAKALFINI